MRRRPFKARSADGPMLFPALEMYYPQRQRIISDEFATRMLSPALRLTVPALGRKPLRNLLEKSLNKQMPGLWGGMVARKRYADDQVMDALAAGISQFVILGAGFDTRAFRLIAPTGADAYEVDLPDNIARKRQVVERLFTRVPEHVKLVPVDFETDDLADSLAAHGLQPDRATMYIIEAVTQYLTEDAIDRLFTTLATAPASSRLIFTYIRRDFLDGQKLDGWDKAYKQWVVNDRVWQFGLAPNTVGDFLQRYGWTEREQVGHEEYRTCYFKPAGRDLAAIDIERFVSAVKD
ncbi:class I SAM-dependent methyltransferase [Mycolicibacterium sp. XJ870]